MLTLERFRIAAILIVTAVAIILILTPRENAAFYLLPLIFALSGLLVHCRFGELRFSLPSKLWQNRSVFRAADNSVWLKFMDAQRQISIPISGMTTAA